MGIFYVIPPYEESFFKGYDDDNFLKECYEAIGCGTAEIARMRDDIAMWVDEEGRLTGKRRNLPATLVMSKALGRLYPVWGTAVFTGYRNNKEGYLPEDFFSTVADSLVVRLR